MGRTPKKTVVVNNHYLFGLTQNDVKDDHFGLETGLLVVNSTVLAI